MKSPTLYTQHVKKHKVQYLIGSALLSISCLLQLIIPRFMESFTDGLQHNTITADQVMKFALWIALVGFGIAFFRSFSRIYLFRLARLLDVYTKRKLFKKWEKLSPSYYDQQRIGNLMSHAINDVNLVRDSAMNGSYMTIEAIILISLTTVAMIFEVNLWLTILVMIPLPVLTFMGYKFRFEIQNRATKVQEAISMITSRVQEFCSGIRIVKTYVQEKEEQDKFTKDNLNNVVAQKNLIRSNSMFLSISQGIVGLSFLISVVFGGYLVLKNVITLGEFVAFNTYLSFLVVPVENLGKVINILQRGKAADIRLRKILSTQPDVKDDEDVLPITEIKGSIEIKDLSFQYPDSDQLSLQDINLSVPEGSSLAIVGRVGSGKTTLMNLLLRLYNPPRGTMYVDGREIFRIPLKTLRGAIGYVPQDYFLFSSSITDNIAFDPKGYGTEQVREAAKIAQVHDNIIDFPQKFDTKLGERGISLSGGQRQRISMARALIKNPSILIFDDSLSAVDAETEEQILKGLKRVMHGRTTIIVSHRISAIRKADQIIVMDQGRIAEQGSHEELVKQGGIYASMHLQQQLNREMGG